MISTLPARAMAAHELQRSTEPGAVERRHELARQIVAAQAALFVFDRLGLVADEWAWTDAFALGLQDQLRLASVTLVVDGVRLFYTPASKDRREQLRVLADDGGRQIADGPVNNLADLGRFLTAAARRREERKGAAS